MGVHVKRPNRLSRRLAAIIVCCTLATTIHLVVSVGASDSVIRNDTSSGGGGSSLDSRAGTTKPIRARISLESKNFDLVGEEENYGGEQKDSGRTVKPTSNEKTQNSAEIASNKYNRALLDVDNNGANAITNRIRHGTGAKKLAADKSSRQLGNIWSMFLPGSSKSESSDYETGNESVEEDSETNNVDNDELGPTTTTVRQTDAALANQAINDSARAVEPDGKQGDKLVAKLLEQPKKQQQQSFASPPSSELMLASSSAGQQVRSSGTNNPWMRQMGANNAANMAPQANTTTSDVDKLQEPVHLITGALSNPAELGGTTPPNMNEIVSDIMSSLGATNKTSSTMGSSPAVEREGSGPTVASTAADSEAASDDKTESDSDLNLTNRTAAAIGSDNSNFERWLNKIKTLQAPPTTNSGAAATKREQTTLKPWQQTWSSKSTKTNAATHAKTPPSPVTSPLTSGEKIATSSDNKGPPSGAGGRLKWAQQHHLSNTIGASQLEGDGLAHSIKQPIRDLGVKGMPKRATHQQQQQHLEQQLDNYRLKYQSHPFQQQMRQQQAQLIHGIKHPSAQASTISVSTQDGASNTSLAFGSHYIPQINPINSNGGLETSQAVDLSSSSALLQNQPAGPTNHNTGNDTGNSTQTANGNQEQQHSIYQSQDEILRQVTSAINFEQQQLLQNQRQQQQQPDPNVRKDSSDKQLVAGGDNSDSNYMTPDGAFRFQNGTISRPSLSSSLESANSTAPSVPTASPLDSMLKAAGLRHNNVSSTGGHNQSSEALDSMDIDKSFELLAERVRQLAASQQQNLQQQQQQQLLLLLAARNNSNQPSWLRPSQLAATGGQPGDSPVLKVDNLSELLANFGGQQKAQQQQQQQKPAMNLDQVHELLQKHERTKIELKNSQETMMELMKQMVALKQSNSSIAGHNDPSSHRAGQANLINDDQHATGSLMMKLGSGESASGPRNQPQAGAAEADSVSPPAGGSNIGWMPLAGQIANQQVAGGNGRGQQQQIGPHLPPSRASPANLVKSRLKFPPHHEQQQQQQVMMNKQHPIGNNVGLMLAPQMADELGDNELDQRIIGLPIALLNNNEEVELSHGQLEEAARMAAEQLGAIPSSHHHGHHHHHLTSHPSAQQHHSHQHMHHHADAAAAAIGKEPLIGNHGQRQRGGNNKFVARVAPNQAAQNRQQQQQQQVDHLASVQKLLQSSSPQAFAQLDSMGVGGQQAANRPEADFLHHHRDKLNQHRENLLQIEKLVSLLPPEQRHQLTSNSQLFNDRNLLALSAMVSADTGNNNNSNSSMVNGLNDQLSGSGSLQTGLSGRQQQKFNRPGGDNSAEPSRAAHQVRGGTNRNQSGEMAPAHVQSNMQQQQQQQERRQQQIVESNLGPNVAVPILGQYGQVPRPASESLMQEFRPLIESSRGYTELPARGSTGDDMTGGPMLTTTTINGANGPPIKMRELSIYRPFGFRGHHAVTYQASPAVASMFPRLVAQPAPMVDSAGRLTQSPYLPQSPLMPARPSILRHMTPIRATINESQRLISQLLPQQLAGHLGHYHRYYHHQYPTHTNLGTLPIPPMRQHHLISYPMRRNQPQPAQHGKLLNNQQHWRHKLARSNSDYAAPSRMQVKHLEPEMGDKEAAEYSLANEDDDEHLFQVSGGDEPLIVLPQQPIDSDGDDTNFSEQLVQQQHLHSMQVPETQRQHINGEEHRRSCPGRQMGIGIDPGRTSDHTIANQLSRLRIDKPVGLPITQPCLPINSSYNATGAPMTTTPNPLATPIQNLTSEASSSAMNKSTTTTPITTLETNRTSTTTTADPSSMIRSNNTST